MKALILASSIYLFLSIFLFHRISAAEDTTSRRPLPPRLKNIKLLSSELLLDKKLDISSHPNFYLLPNTSQCGYSAGYLNKKDSSKLTNDTTSSAARQKRLVGGNYPMLGIFPWAARVELIDGETGNFSLRCGATLINSRYILTSARCLTGLPSAQTLKHIILGTPDRRSSYQCAGENDTVNCVNSTLVDIDDTIIHEEFVKTSAWNDIALIRMSDEVKFSDYVRPVCLPTNDDVLSTWTNNRLTAYGWGRQESDDESEPYYYSWNLQSLNISMNTRDSCDRVYRRMTGKLNKSRFCAGGEAEKGTCKADTGGPVMKKVPVKIAQSSMTEDRYYQFGIIHFGRCALEGIPSIYVNVMYYMNWILDNIEP
ncbi:unnamed protein product [Allacma fusca]|uniref:Peptidase S1 domain-containing protein n=1 Tax=Allacma fusca TaxID=39272 RepID=A0A8J2PNL5_9HEXA|nr:unnamed protein product [Allacma fusca]